MEMAVIDDGSLHTIEESPGMSKEEMFDDTSEIKKATYYSCGIVQRRYACSAVISSVREKP